jgi:hypothetical protein
MNVSLPRPLALKLGVTQRVLLVLIGIVEAVLVARRGDG